MGQNLYLRMSVKIYLRANLKAWMGTQEKILYKCYSEPSNDKKGINYKDVVTDSIIERISTNLNDNESRC